MMALAQVALKRVVYVSQARPVKPGQSMAQMVDEILAVSRRNNLRRGLTGALVCGAGRFAQVLEGPADQVDLVLSIIGQDPRHTGLTLLEDAAAERRAFANWTMALLEDVELLPEELAEAGGALGLVLRLRSVLREGAALAS
jgi:hypothetical protein